MYETCFRIGLKHASLWAEIFKKVRLKGLLSYLHMYRSNTCRTAANRILRSTSTIPTARQRCCFWVRGLTLFYVFANYFSKGLKTTNQRMFDDKHIIPAAVSLWDWRCLFPGPEHGEVRGHRG